MWTQLTNFGYRTQVRKVAKQVISFRSLDDPRRRKCARIELQILYEEMLSRLPPFRLDPKDPPQFHCGNIIGVDRLSLVWDT
jgi:hypothetical protein